MRRACVSVCVHVCVTYVYNSLHHVCKREVADVNIVWINLMVGFLGGKWNMKC